MTNINSPTVNKALPGNTFFTPNTPGKGSGAKGGGNPVVAVGPNGKSTNLQDTLALARYTRQQFGPVKNKQQAKDLMESFLTLATGQFPNVNFASVKDSDITVTSTSNGGLEVTGKVYAKNNQKVWFGADWTFDSKGKFAGGNRSSRGLSK